ncbi:scabin-related ADP-ribosyltransferase [Kribbella solani]|uniref:Pierisin-like domain-containing protein n=1 Tax=Kribbella solani TaxID=236067 RepID=A0A841DML0_9ACTN|nr:hypothetical protein [Kribbella solani]MBB5980364.1 hypothetical protein [Kribbella solani]
MGIGAGAAASSVGKALLGKSTSGAASTTRTLFRGDTRGPGKLFTPEGFVAKGGEAGYRDYVFGKGDGNWVSTSRSERIAKDFSATDPNSRRGWVYEIADPGNGIDPRRVTPRFPRFLRGEKEISFKGSIPGSYVKSARPTKWGEWDGPAVKNPGFGGGG